MTIRRITALTVAATAIAVGGGKVASAHADNTPSNTSVTHVAVQHTSTKTKCVPVNKSNRHLVYQVEFYHLKYVHWRHAMHRPVMYGYGHTAETTCNVAYVKWARNLWHFRAHRAHATYKRWYK